LRQCETLRKSLDQCFDLRAQRANFILCGAEFVAQFDETSCHALIDLGLAKSMFTDGTRELIDRGLALNPGEPEKAYFNRGLAEEGLDNIPAAYRDYSHAAELKPDWAPPRNELSRFTVATRPS